MGATSQHAWSFLGQTAMIASSTCKSVSKKLHSDAALPVYAHGPEEDAGLDLRAVESVVLSPGYAQGVPTGIAIELPPGYEAQVRPRSGMALKHSLTVNFGTIDPGYRGEIRVIMFNLGRADYTIEKGDRIAQLVVAKYEAIVMGGIRSEQFRSRRRRLRLIRTLASLPEPGKRFLLLHAR